MAHVARLQNPTVLEKGPVRELFVRAFDGYPLLPAGFEDAAEDFQKLLPAPHVGVFVGAEKGQFKGLAVVLLPVDKSVPVPQVFHFYTEGRSVALRDALVGAVVDFVVQSGYSTFWAINMTRKADTVWARAFRKAGTAKRLGSVMEFGVG